MDEALLAAPDRLLDHRHVDPAEVFLDQRMRGRLADEEEVPAGIQHRLAERLAGEQVIAELSGASAKSMRLWCCCDTETTWGAMPPSAPPDKGVLVGVPVIGGTLHGLLDLGPCLKATPLQRKRAQHLPPRLQQVQIGGID